MTTVLDEVRRLAPAIRARAEEIEAARCLLAGLFDELRAAGMFGMLAPRSHGGDEVGARPASR